MLTDPVKKAKNNSPPTATATEATAAADATLDKSATVAMVEPVSDVVVKVDMKQKQTEYENALYDFKTSWIAKLVWCGVVWCGVVWCGVAWCGRCGGVWCGVVWCGGVWCGVVGCGVVWCGVVWCGVVWRGVVWCGEVWRGVVWYGVVKCGVVWFNTATTQAERGDLEFLVRGVD